MRLRPLVVVVATILAGIAVAPAGADAATPATGPGGIGVRLVAPTGVGAGNPLARTYIVGVLAPGTSIRRRLEIENSTLRAQDVAVYPAAAHLGRGLFAYAAGRERNDLARWTSVSRPLLHLQSGGKTFVTVSVDVPRDASAGEHYAVVWAELSALAISGVRLVNRVGIRLYLTVAPGGTAPASFTIGSLDATRSLAGVPRVTATLRNTGPRTLLIGGNLTLSNGPGGLRVGPLPAEILGALSPRGSAELSVQLDPRLPAGPWHARLRLHSGRIERVATATLTFPRSQPVGAAPVAKGSAWTRHLLLGILIVNLLLAAAIATPYAVRRARAARCRR